MAVTIKSSILNYDGATALTGEVSIPDGTSVINGAGSGTSVTFGARLSCSFTFSDTITPGIYEVRYVKADGTVWASGLVWIEAASGTYYVNDIARLAVYQQRLARNLESPVRSTADTLPLEFEWPISGATFANSASTCKRRFLGETGAQEEALSGAITAISGKAGWYKIAYALADRAADGATVIPTSVTYTLVDDAGNSGELALVIVEFAANIDSGGVVPPSQSGTESGNFWIWAGVDFSESFDVTIPSGWDKVLFTVKDGQSIDEANDANAILQLKVSSPSSNTDGVLYLNRDVAADKTLGSLVVANDRSSVTVTLKAALTSQLRSGKTYNWDFAVIDGSTKPYFTSPGTVNIKDVVTKTLP